VELIWTTRNKLEKIKMANDIKTTLAIKDLHQKVDVYQ
jgi:hypothetical protein